MYFSFIRFRFDLQLFQTFLHNSSGEKKIKVLRRKIERESANNDNEKERGREIESKLSKRILTIVKEERWMVSIFPKKKRVDLIRGEVGKGKRSEDRFGRREESGAYH